MRQLTGIVCEFDPFHQGHFYLLSEVRRRNPETTIVCALSGAFVQRGDPACFSAWDRARAAAACGADLVLLLPFPYSMAPADRFAAAGVSLLRDLGCDTLAFGTENAEEAALRSIAEKLDSPEFSRLFKNRLLNQKHDSEGFPSLRWKVYREQYGEEEASLMLTPNNILGIEYLRHAEGLEPILVPRTGAAHGENGLKTGSFASSTAIRSLLRSGETEQALSLLPAPAAAVFRDALIRGTAVLFPEEKASPIVFWTLGTRSPEELSRFAGAEGGVAEYLIRKARFCSSLQELFSSLESKKHTRSFYRRAVWSCVLGVTPEMLSRPPAFSLVLAATPAGQRVLRNRKGSIPILSRPASGNRLSGESETLFRLSLRSELFRSSLSDSPLSESQYLALSPFLTGKD